MKRCGKILGRLGIGRQIGYQAIMITWMTFLIINLSSRSFRSGILDHPGIIILLAVLLLVLFLALYDSCSLHLYEDCLILWSIVRRSKYTYENLTEVNFVQTRSGTLALYYIHRGKRSRRRYGISFSDKEKQKLFEILRQRGFVQQTASQGKDPKYLFRFIKDTKRFNGSSETKIELT